MENVTLGEFIRRAREAAGITREELAAAVGWAHPNSVRHVETGHTDVSREKLAEVLQAIGVPRDEWGSVLLLPRTAGEEAA